MLELISSMFSYVRIRLFSISCKKRIAISLLVLLFLVFMLRPYFFANLAELDLFGESSNRGNFTAGWDKWTGQMEKLGYRSIGDVYDQCGRLYFSVYLLTCCYFSPWKVKWAYFFRNASSYAYHIFKLSVNFKLMKKIPGNIILMILFKWNSWIIIKII